jgi:hypothetical protein
MELMVGSRIDSYGWSVTWCRAFPTLLGLHFHSAELVYQLWPLAWRTLYPNDSTASCTTTTTATIEDSCSSRLESGWHDSLGYGEIDPETVFYLMNWLQTHGHLQPRPGRKTTVFDLGSGDGKVILATALCLTTTETEPTTSTIATLVGLEIVPHLHNQALKRMQSWREYATTNPVEIHFTCDDFTRHHARISREADLIWIHATVFENALFQRVQEICNACRPGTLFVLISRPLNDKSKIETLLSKRLKMSWGDGMVFVQRRR